MILGAKKDHRAREAAERVEEVLVFIGKDHVVKHVITFVRRDEIKSRYTDFMGLDVSEKDLVIMLS